MNIGIDARLYRSSTAGIGRYSQNLIKNLLKIDKTNRYILFMTLEDKKEFENWLNENSLKIDNCKLKIVVTDIPHYSLAEQVKLPKIIAKEKVDLMLFLHCNVPVFYRDKFIVVIHDLTLIYFPQAAKKTNFLKQKAFYYITKKACQNARKIIAVSENTKKDIIREFQIPNEKIQTIYEAADDKKFKSQISNLKIKEKYGIDKPVILYVGQYRRHKNISNLIAAFGLLKKDLPAKLVLIGKDAAGVEIDKDIAKDVIRPGFVSDEELNAWYHLAEVFCFPSLYEGFGLPGLEAMMAGTAVVSSNKASLPEIYKDGAIYFDPSNPTDIAGKIKMVLADKASREKMVERGRKIALSYSWQKTAKETLKIINSV